MSNYNYERIGYSDYWDVYIKRDRDKIELIRFTALEEDTMMDYIDSNVDLLSEWQDDAYHWRTELGYDDRKQNYEYQYSDYYQYDGIIGEYYDENETWMTRNYFYTDSDSKETVIEKVMNLFDDDYMDWNFERAGMDEQQLRETIWKYYDDCIQYAKELEERNKPHRNAFSYYK